MAAEALGLGDLGKVIDPADFDKVDSDDYVFSEDNEKIFFIIKSKRDEYCFTNFALIHLDGDSAVSSKRFLKRYLYSRHAINNVYLETAGTVDRDVEIKFTIGSQSLSIDVDKRQIDKVKDLYKALFKISEIVATNEEMFEYAKTSVNVARDSVGRLNNPNALPADQFNTINQSAFNWLKTNHNTFKIKDFGHVFAKYISKQ